MTDLQTQNHALDSLQTPSDLDKTGFPQFGRLPQEIQNAIWKEALQAEAQKIVLHDFETGGIYLSQDLVSSISQANSASNTIANEFYNVRLRVFACDLEWDVECLIRPRRHQRGVVRLNLEYATMMVGFDPYDVSYDDGWWSIGLPWDSEALQNKLYKGMTDAERHKVFKEHYHLWATVGRPCRGEDVPAWVTNCHVTSKLTKRKRAQVRRTVELVWLSEVLEVLDTFQQPPCCWNCDFSHRVRFEDFACEGDFPNVEFCRLLVTRGYGDLCIDGYNARQLIDDCANLTTAQWWDSIKSKLMFCAKHENLHNENKGGNNDGDEMIDEDIDNADVDAAVEFDVADQHVTKEDDAEKNTEDDVGKREDKGRNKFASVCAREVQSFFFLAVWFALRDVLCPKVQHLPFRNKLCIRVNSRGTLVEGPRKDCVWILWYEN